jgi:hypothetical protein
VFAALDNLHASIPFELLIHGGAQGADDLADAWARERGIVRQMYRPNWKAHGRAAGPIRNQRMIDEGKPTIVVAFTGGAGTADMCRRAIAAGLVVVLA